MYIAFFLFWYLHKDWEFKYRFLYFFIGNPSDPFKLKLHFTYAITESIITEDHS